MADPTGFTVIEVILVIALISILALLSGYSINSLLVYSRLKSDFRELYFSFLKARQYAITKQQDYGLKFDSSKNQYTIFSESSGNIKTRKLNEGIEFKEGEITFGGDKKMSFKPLGTAEGGHVTITDNNLDYKITVSGSTGRVRFKRIDE